MATGARIAVPAAAALGLMLALAVGSLAPAERRLPPTAITLGDRTTTLDALGSAHASAEFCRVQGVGSLTNLGARADLGDPLSGAPGLLERIPRFPRDAAVSLLILVVLDPAPAHADGARPPATRGLDSPPSPAAAVPEALGRPVGVIALVETERGSALEIHTRDDDLGWSRDDALSGPIGRSLRTCALDAVHARIMGGTRGRHMTAIWLDDPALRTTPPSAWP